MIGIASGATVTWYLVGMRRIRQGRVPVRRRGWRRRPLYGPDAVEPDAVPSPTAPPPPPPPLGSRGREMSARAAPPSAPSDPTVADRTVVAPSPVADRRRRGAVGSRAGRRPDRGRCHDARRSPRTDHAPERGPRSGPALDAGPSRHGGDARAGVALRARGLGRRGRALTTPTRRAGRCGRARGQERRSRRGWGGCGRTPRGGPGPRLQPVRPRRPRTTNRGRTTPG